MAAAVRVVLALLLLAAAPARGAEPAQLLEGFGRARGMIETPVACHLLDLWVAVTPAQRAQGLMYVRELGEYEGMLFPNRQPAIASMWMKNTFIPLDMLFILEGGRIAAIAAETTPLSEQSVRADVPVIAVLELSGGFSGRHGVAAGDRFSLLD